jgi:ribosome-binding factor A
MAKARSNQPSQRQLRVGETIRSALAQVFAHAETHIPELDSASITISEVRISPDLKNATVYYMPLAGEKQDIVLQALKDHTGHIRKLMNAKIVLRYSPKLYFKLDTSFEEASRIHGLLNQEKVRKDIGEA